MSVTAAEVDVRPFEPADAPAVLDLLTLTMSGGPTGERSVEFFSWKHLENPFGSSPGMLACHEGRVVGVRLFLRWDLHRGGRTYHCLRAVDTATHPDFLRQGIFTRLTQSLLDHLREVDPVDFVFNTPNAMSRPGNLRMGWSDVATLPVHVAPVRPLRFARGVMDARRANAASGAEVMSAARRTTPSVTSPLPRAESLLDDVAALSDLLAQRRPDPRLRTALTPDYLRWRYVDVPGLDYRVVPVRDRTGTLIGAGIGRVRTRAGLVEFTLAEVVVRDGDRRTAGRILSGARRSGADHVAVLAPGGSEIAGQLPRHGYVRVPGNGIRLVARPENGDRTVLDPGAWAMSLGELEVF